MNVMTQCLLRLLKSVENILHIKFSNYHPSIHKVSKSDLKMIGFNCDIFFKQILQIYEYTLEKFQPPVPFQWGTGYYVVGGERLLINDHQDHKLCPFLSSYLLRVFIQQTVLTNSFCTVFPFLVCFICVLANCI